MTENASNLQRRIVTVAGREVGVTTYKVGARFSCRIDNVDPGAIIARAMGPTREEAENVALANASMTLNLQEAKDALRRSIEQLRGNKPNPNPEDTNRGK